MCLADGASKLLKTAAPNCSRSLEVRPSRRRSRWGSWTSLWETHRRGCTGRRAGRRPHMGWWKSASRSCPESKPGNWAERRGQDPPECLLPRVGENWHGGTQSHQKPRRRSRDPRVLGPFALGCWGTSWRVCLWEKSWTMAIQLTALTHRLNFVTCPD